MKTTYYKVAFDNYGTIRFSTGDSATKVKNSAIRQAVHDLKLYKKIEITPAEQRKHLTFFGEITVNEFWENTSSKTL